MLQYAGFKVYDLGRECRKSKRLLVKASEIKPDVVATSALMTTTWSIQIQVEDQLKESGLRAGVKTMVGVVHLLHRLGLTRDRR
jgi:trimethylamine corrinoid protein